MSIQDKKEISSLSLCCLSSDQMTAQKADEEEISSPFASPKGEQQVPSHSHLIFHPQLLSLSTCSLPVIMRKEDPISPAEKTFKMITVLSPLFPSSSHLFCLSNLLQTT